VNPVAVDARTEITTQLLSDKGYSIIIENAQGMKEEQIYYHKDFEKKFLSDETNKILCKTFIENALRDPMNLPTASCGVSLGYDDWGCISPSVCLPTAASCGVFR
jgi:hypothetical protein